MCSSKFPQNGPKLSKKAPQTRDQTHFWSVLQYIPFKKVLLKIPTKMNKNPPLKITKDRGRDGEISFKSEFEQKFPFKTGVFSTFSTKWILQTPKMTSTTILDMFCNIFLLKMCSSKNPTNGPKSSQKSPPKPPNRDQTHFWRCFAIYFF